MHEWQETKNAVRPDSNSPLSQLSWFLSMDTRDNGVLRLENRFDPLSNCVYLKKKNKRKKKKKEREKKRMERGEKKRKEKKRKARYVDTWRVVSFYDRYRCINGPRIETQRTATRDFCCVQERKGEKKEEEDVEKGLLPTGRNMNSRLTYFFSYVENYGETYKFTWRCYSSLSLSLYKFA